MGQTSDMARALFVGSLSLLLSVSVSLRNAGRENLSRFPGTADGGTEKLGSAQSSHCQSHALSALSHGSGPAFARHSGVCMMFHTET